MSYLVLARKYRPQTFGQVVGQGHISRALSSALAQGKVSHALLFTGPRGVGKTSVARILARALNCTAPVVPEGSTALLEPCGACENCREIGRSTSLAVREIDGASNNSVENVRELIETLRSLPPPNCKYKVYIIDEVHMLSVAAFNALLKSLEEPPPHTIFIFATTEPNKIPATVISRCQRHDFHRVPTSLIADNLEQIIGKEGISATRAVCTYLASRSDGGMRDALSMLDRLISASPDSLELEEAEKIFGTLSGQFFFDLSDQVLSGQVASALTTLEQAFASSIDLRTFLSDFVRHWRGLLLLSCYQQGKKEQATLANVADMEVLEWDSEVSERAIEQLRKVSRHDLLRLFDLARETVDTALHSNYPRYVVEAGVARMATLEPMRNLAEVISRVESALSGDPQVLRQAMPSATQTSASVSHRDSPPKASRPPTHRPVNPVVDKVKVEADTGTADIPHVERTGLSWKDFVRFVRSRSEVVLAEYLKRVVDTEFSPSAVILHGAKFDAEFLLETDHKTRLDQLLREFFDKDKVVLKIHVREQSAQATGNQVTGTQDKSSASPARSSIAQEQKQAEELRRRETEKRGRESPLVQAVLETFDGSHIEKVLINN